MTPEQLEMQRQKDRDRKAVKRAQQRNSYKKVEAVKRTGHMVLTPWMLDELGNPSRILYWVDEKGGEEA